MIHHRQRLALVMEAGQDLGGIHADLHHLKSHAPANGFTLLGEINGAHAPFAQRSKDTIPAEVVITSSAFRCIDGAGSGFVRSNRTLECAQDQTLRTQSGGVAGTQLLSTLRAVWHFKPEAWAYCTPFVPEAFVPCAQTL